MQAPANASCRENGGTHMKQYEKTGALIAAARKEKAMTQKALAQVLHISDTTVSKWERGVSQS